jgi:hypothetical protein
MRQPATATGRARVVLIELLIELIVVFRWLPVH